MKKIFIIFIVTILFSCKSNYTRIGDKDANYIPYYLKVYEADSLYIVGNFDKSYKILDSLFKKYEPININTYNEYLIYTKLKVLKNNNIKKDLIKLIQEFGYYRDILQEDSILKNKLEQYEFNDKLIDKMEKNYLNKININTRLIISKMDYEDQKARNERNNIVKIDKKNDSILRNLILNNKFPNQKYTGKYHIGRNIQDYNGLDLIINHMGYYQESFEFYKKYLKELMQKGNCPPFLYATLIDKKSVIDNKLPFYYSKYLNDLNNLLKSKKDYNTIDKERKLVGLPSVQQEIMWYKKMNINLN
jgi:hypothetical protein